MPGTGTPHSLQNLTFTPCCQCSIRLKMCYFLFSVGLQWDTYVCGSGTIDCNDAFFISLPSGHVDNR